MRIIFENGLKLWALEGRNGMTFITDSSRGQAGESTSASGEFLRLPFTFIKVKEV